MTIKEALEKRYSHIHPLLFSRCVERSRTDAELFDMLDSMPNKYPIIWDEVNRVWKHTSDLLQAEEQAKETQW